MQVTVFHPGTQHSWQTALALQQLGRLESYRTSIFYQPDKFPYRLERMLPGPLARRASAEFRRFSHPGLNPALVHTVGLAEWAERIAARAGLRGVAQTIDRFGNRQFVRHLAESIRSDKPFALWGYNGSSLSSFQLAKQARRTCILDRTNGDFRIYNAMMDDIAERYGDWFLPIERKVADADIADDEREYHLADAILVGSPFAAETIYLMRSVARFQQPVQNALHSEATSPSGLAGSGSESRYPISGTSSRTRSTAFADASADEVAWTGARRSSSSRFRPPALPSARYG